MNIMPKGNIPSTAQVLADPSTSYWLRNSIVAARNRDPLDAARDAELLAKILLHDLEQQLRQGLRDGRVSPL
jgi:hypothetical protein